MTKTKHDPRLILVWVARNYLNDIEFKNLLDELAVGSNRGGEFFRTLLKHFDIERIKTKNTFKEDELIYNYIKYDHQAINLPRTELLAHYENRIAIPALELTLIVAKFQESRNNPDLVKIIKAANRRKASPEKERAYREALGMRLIVKKRE
jgi:hypothetical protein